MAVYFSGYPTQMMKTEPNTWYILENATDVGQQLDREWLGWEGMRYGLCKQVPGSSDMEIKFFEDLADLRLDWDECHPDTNVFDRLLNGETLTITDKTFLYPRMIDVQNGASPKATVIRQILFWWIERNYSGEFDWPE